MGRLKGVATGGQDHEPSADKVRTIQQLKRYLCDLAWPAYGKADPEMCRICPSQCAYGRRFLELTEEAKEKEKMSPVKTNKENDVQEKMSALQRQNDELARANLAKACELQKMEEKVAQAEKRAQEAEYEKMALELMLMKVKAMVFDMEHKEAFSA